MKGTLICAALAAAAVTAGCQAPPKSSNGSSPPLTNPRISTPKVTLQVKQDQLDVVGGETPNCGGGNAARGCIVTGLANISVVRFELRGSGQYGLTRLWLCNGDSKPSPVPDGCTLSSFGQEEFIVIAGSVAKSPGEDGEVNLSEMVQQPGVREFLLVNQNSFPARYFYLLEACRGNACTVLDPRVHNGGRRVTF